MPTNPREQMHRIAYTKLTPGQGEGVVRWTEPVALTMSCVRRDGAWTVLRAEEHVA